MPLQSRGCLARLGVLVVVIGCMAWWSLEARRMARMSANEAGVGIAFMRDVRSAEDTFLRGQHRFGSLDELVRAHLLGWHFDGCASPCEKGGYRLELRTDGTSYEATASPTRYDETGRRSFYLGWRDQEIRAADRRGAPATSSDPVLQ